MAYCGECRRHFINEWALQQHLDNALVHAQSSSEEDDSSSEEDDEHWCYQCSRSFADEHSLRQHELSTAHVGRNEECPYCSRTFRNETDVVKHMEAGTCAGGMNRLEVDRRVRATDTSRLFTSPMVRRSRRGRLVYMEEDDVWATRDDAWNGYAFECPHCSVTHDTLEALNGHITSIHFPTRRDYYECCGDNCDRTFMFFSQLMGHIENNTQCDARESNDYYAEQLDSMSLFEWVDWD